MMMTAMFMGLEISSGSEGERLYHEWLDRLKQRQEARSLSKSGSKSSSVQPTQTNGVFDVKQEADPNGKDPHEPGAKLDAGKVCLYRGAIDYFPRAIEQVAAVSTFGASKYAWKGWQTVPEGFERYSDAMVRHLIAEGKGETRDHDSGLLHASHAAWNALARLELILKDIQHEHEANERGG